MYIYDCKYNEVLDVSKHELMYQEPLCLFYTHFILTDTLTIFPFLMQSSF